MPHPDEAFSPISLPRPPRRILVVKPSALGDVVHSLPVAELLTERFPAARLSWLIAPAFAGMVAGHPCVAEVIPFDRRGLGGWTTRGPDRTFAAWLDLGRSLADRDFDLVIDLQGLARSALLTWATNAPVRVGFGYARELAPLAYTHRVPSRGTTERHAIERYLDVAEALGCGRGPVRFRFPVTDADRAAVRAMLGDARPYAVLMPGTNWATKRWPIARYAELAGRVEAELGLRAVIAGGADVVELARLVPGAINLASRTSLPQLVALLAGASLVVANDSGPMHVASALGVPLVTIFGPTNPVRTGPYGRMDTVIRADIACSPCYARRCSHTSCMNELSVAHVLAQARIVQGGTGYQPV